MPTNPDPTSGAGVIDPLSLRISELQELINTLQQELAELEQQKEDGDDFDEPPKS